MAPPKTIPLPLLKHMKELVNRDIEDGCDDHTKERVHRDKKNETLLIWINQEIAKRRA